MRMFQVVQRDGINTSECGEISIEFSIIESIILFINRKSPMNQ